MRPSLRSAGRFRSIPSHAARAATEPNRMVPRPAFQAAIQGVPTRDRARLQCRRERASSAAASSVRRTDNRSGARA